MAVYKRVLLKLSGEALKTGSDLFDFEQVHRAAAVIRKMADMGTQIGIVIGAGNIWRGRQGPAANMDAVTADQMGMLGTVINCLCMADALRQAGVDAVVMSAVDMNRFCEPFNAMTARASAPRWADSQPRMASPEVPFWGSRPRSAMGRAMPTNFAPLSAA